MESPGEWISMEKKIKDWALGVSNIRGWREKEVPAKVSEKKEPVKQPEKTEEERAGGPRAAVPSPWDLMLDYLSWNWWE